MAPKIALITGVSRAEALGFAVARQLATQAYHVVLATRGQDRAERLAETLRSDGLAASSVELDLTSRDSIQAAAAAVSDQFGRLDVLVNNASTMPDFAALSALDADIDAVRGAVEVDVLGPWRLIQATLPLLRQAEAARIVNVTSIAAQQIATGLDLHAALRSPGHSLGKFLLEVLTARLAKELKDDGILVNAVDPGQTATHPERGDEDDARSAADSARGVVWAATLGADGPTGGVFRDGEPVS